VLARKGSLTPCQKQARPCALRAVPAEMTMRRAAPAGWASGVSSSNRKLSEAPVVVADFGENEAKYQTTRVGQIRVAKWARPE
jgi:hypothetical protein